ncbi:MAG: glycosyltransferase family 2 protein [Eubacteriales bacterium]|nr:glycosyltransferase family 2 protein [Eubacteriales bacterium]
MKDLLYYIDTMEFCGNMDPVLWVSGWCACPDGTEVRLLLCDEQNREIPAELKKIDRSDVIESMTELKNCDPLCGFILQVSEPEKNVLSHRTVSLIAEYGDRRKVLRSRKGEKLKEEFRNQSLQITVESWGRGEKTTKIVGWATAFYEECGIRVLNMKGEELPAEIRRGRRFDLERIRHITEETEPAFTVLVANEAMEGTDLQLEFTGGGRSERQVIHTADSKAAAPKKTFLTKLRNPDYWKRGVKYLHRHGIKATINHIIHPPKDMGEEYSKWFIRNRIKPEELEKQREEQKNFAERPLISICIPLYNTRIAFLDALLESIIGQSYTRWELCLADGSTNDDVEKHIKAVYGKYLRDPAEAAADAEGYFHYQRLKENFGIAGNTNYAIKMASGDFIMLTDHDDYLELDALYEIAKAINSEEKPDILYTDEDLTDESGEIFSSPRFKPDYNPDFLTCINYICHIFVARAAIMKEVGGFRKEYDGAQDWDMILRCCEKSDRICHIPKVLYHWRAHEESTAGNPDSKNYAIDSGKRAVEEHFRRLGMEAELEYTGIFILFRPHLHFAEEPKVSIIIPSYDHVDTLRTCVESVLEKTTYKNYEIIIVENNSKEEKTFAYYKELEAAHSNVKVVYYKEEGPFNYSKVNNFGIAHAEGEYYILLNNDTRLITGGWIEEMLGYCTRENTGIVGAKLYYEDQTVQHSGAVIGMGGFAGHILTESMRGDAGYFGYLQAIHDVSAVTAACLMIKKSVYDEVGGLDEDFRVALNDMDLCLKVRKAGKLVVMDPAVELFHYESKSRGSEEAPEKHERFKQEIRMFREKWADILEKGDPYYSPNLSLMFGDCRVRAADEYFDIVEEIKRDERR